MAGNVDAGWTLLTEGGMKASEELSPKRGREDSLPTSPAQCTSPPFTCSLSPQLTGHTSGQWEPWLCVIGMYCDGCHGRDGERHSSGSK